MFVNDSTAALLMCYYGKSNDNWCCDDIHSIWNPFSGFVTEPLLCLGNGIRASGNSRKARRLYAEHHPQRRIASHKLFTKLQQRLSDLMHTALQCYPVYRRLCSPCGSRPIFQFLNPYTVGLLWREISPSQQNKRTQTSTPLVGFEPTIPMFERAQTVHALDRSGTVIGNVSQHRMRLGDEQWGRIWKGMVETCLKILSQHSTDETQKSHGNPLHDSRYRYANVFRAFLFTITDVLQEGS
jgi:hypothetical protein